MQELSDYSGEFKPDLKLEDFSKDMLRKYLQEVSKLYLLIGGIWYNHARDRFSERTAEELHWEFWETLGGVHEINRPRVALDIWGHDVEAVLKWVQVDPGVGLIFDVDCELKSKDLGILTIKDCNALRYYERHGDRGLLESACGLDCWGFPKGIRRFHPDLSMKCLKVPPRQSPDEPACIWEVRMDPSHSSLVNPDLPEYAQKAAAKADWDLPLR